jgi:AcrR family transcriptional regulator
MATDRSQAKGPRPRRKRRKRELIRGEPIVQRVLQATIEELARVGYRALRIEEVAICAAVNKTTVYRRWPERRDLVRAALEGVTGAKLTPPETGAVRTDLLAVGRGIVALASSAHGRSLMRMMVAEAADAELADIQRELRRQRAAIPLAIIAGAVARGELPQGTESQLLLDTFVGALRHRLFFANEPVTPVFLEQLVDLLLAGILPATHTAADAPRPEPRIEAKSTKTSKTSKASKARGARRPQRRAKT